jgi:hypothetical protein
MVSDNDMSTEGASTEEEEMHGGGDAHEAMSHGAEMGVSMHEEGASEAPSEGAAKSKAKSGGRRAALRILRENVDSVSKDLSNFRKTHEASSKRLEKQVASLRNDVASMKSYFAKENARARSKQEALFSRISSKLEAKQKSVKSTVASKIAKRKAKKSKKK